MTRTRRIFRSGLLIAFIAAWLAEVAWLSLQADWMALLFGFSTPWLFNWLDNRYPAKPIRWEKRRAPL